MSETMSPGQILFEAKKNELWRTLSSTQLACGAIKLAPWLVSGCHQWCCSISALCLVFVACWGLGEGELVLHAHSKQVGIHGNSQSFSLTDDSWRDKLLGCVLFFLGTFIHRLDPVSPDPTCGRNCLEIFHRSV